MSAVFRALNLYRIHRGNCGVRMVYYAKPIGGNYNILGHETGCLQHCYILAVGWRSVSGFSLAGNMQTEDKAESVTVERGTLYSESDSELSETVNYDIISSGSDEDHHTDTVTQKSHLKLFDIINQNATRRVSDAIDRWVKEGNSIERSDVLITIANLRKCKMFEKALQFTEWLDMNKKLDPNEQDYASRLDLVAKVQGLHQAEKYLKKIPESFQGELVYRTLLANFASNRNLKQAEKLFYKMRDLGFPLSTFACEQLIRLYKRFDEKKIVDVLSMMEKENVQPSLMTYKLLIDAKGRSGDAEGMEHVYKKMKSQGIELTFDIQALMAKAYIYSGHHENAEMILKEMEKDRWACVHMFPLYAVLGNANSVDRVWKICESCPSIHECLAAIEAWGKLGQVHKAEAVFDIMEKRWRLSSKCYTALLRVYSYNKLLNKAKILLKKMKACKRHIQPYAWDAVVRMYAAAGEVETADSILQMANLKLPHSSFMAFLCQYARRGDLHNAEKTLQRYRIAGHIVQRQQYLPLLQAYINAKSPAYGFRERMKADNIFLNRSLSGMLQQVDAFNKWD